MSGAQQERHDKMRVEELPANDANGRESEERFRILLEY
jgi:hypothetical protein